jgi:hypothetical protein
MTYPVVKNMKIFHGGLIVMGDLPDYKISKNLQDDLIVRLSPTNFDVCIMWQHYQHVSPLSLEIYGCLPTEFPR